MEYSDNTPGTAIRSMPSVHTAFIVSQVSEAAFLLQTIIEVRAPEERKYIGVKPKYIPSNLLKHLCFLMDKNMRKACMTDDDELLFQLLLSQEAKRISSYSTGNA